MSIDIEHEDSLDSALSGQSQDERLLQSAADTLRGYAVELKLSHTLESGEWPDGEETTKAHHDHMMALAKGLDELRANRQGFLVGSDHIADASKMVQGDVVSMGDLQDENGTFYTKSFLLTFSSVEDFLAAMKAGQCRFTVFGGEV